MKQTRRWHKQILIGLSAAVLIAGMPFSTSRADTYDDQITQLQAEAEGYQTEASRLRGEANNLQNEIAAINAQQQGVRAQITETETRLQQLNNEIANTELRITNVREALTQNLRSIYLEGDDNALLLVASCDTISQCLDKQEARNKINESIQKNIQTLKDLKSSLAKQKEEAESTLARQNAMREDLAAQEVRRNDLLAQTQGQEANYQQLIQNNQAQVEKVRAAQIASFARIFGSGYRSSGSYGSLQYQNLTGNVPCGGGYPSKWCAAIQDSLVDDWQLYNRECVSYVAWALGAKYGKFVPRFNGNGNAEDWPGYLNGKYGIVANETPAVGAAVVLPSEMIGGVGHVALVESVSGGWVHVSQYNWNSPPDGKYSEMDLKVVSGLVFIHFP